MKLRFFSAWAAAWLACWASGFLELRSLSAQEPAAEAQYAKPARKKRASKARAKAKKGRTSAKAKKKQKTAPAYNYEKSKYKALMHEPPATYRFDSNRNPVAPQGSKKNSSEPQNCSGEACR